MSVMSRRLKDPVVTAFSEGMVKELGAKLKEIWLFGSRARHEAGEGSDYDFLIVADCPRSEIAEATVAESCALLDQFGAFIGPENYDSPLWERAKESSLGKDILREGFKVYER